MSILRKIFFQIKNNLRKINNDKPIRRQIKQYTQEEFDEAMVGYCGNPALSKEEQYKNAYKKYKNNTLFNPNKRDHIILDDTSNIKKTDRGLAFVREQLENNKTNLRIATKFEIDNFNIIAIGGLDFDSPRHLSALLKATTNLFKIGLTLYEEETINKINLKEQNKTIAIYPEVSRQERYDAAIKYSLDQSYYPKYIEKRVEKYLLPKIVTDNKLTPLKNITTLMSFSVGGREIMMMENALKTHISSNWKIEESELKEILQNFWVFSLGYAIDPSHIKSPGFSKIFVFSIDDHGVLRPYKLFHPYLVNDEVREMEFSRHELAECQYLVVLGHDMIPAIVDGKLDNDTHHSLPHYVEACNCFTDGMKLSIHRLFSGNLIELEIIGDNSTGMDRN